MFWVWFGERLGERSGVNETTAIFAGEYNNQLKRGSIRTKLYRYWGLGWD